MKFNQYERMYSSSNRLGERDILGSYLGLQDGCFYPLSISHGVDFGHCYGPMDANGFEPLHWAYNSIIKEKSEGGKPCVMIPHPWAMLAEGRDFLGGNGTLIVGPPPGPNNDAMLYNIVGEMISQDQSSVLVKPRGNYHASCQFWSDRGVDTVSVGGGAKQLYQNLFAILEQFDRVIGCTFSSALIFAASIGKKVDIVRGFSYEFYDAGDYLERVDFQSDVARSVVRDFVNGSYEDKTRIARSLLGFDYLDGTQDIEERLKEAFREVYPFWLGRDPAYLRKLFAEVARMTGRFGLLRHSLSSMVSRSIGNQPQREASVIWMNELGIWLDGLNDRTFSIRKVPYVEGVTIPGLALDQYPD